MTPSLASELMYVLLRARCLNAGEYTTTGNMLRPLIHNKVDASFMSLKDDQTRVKLSVCRACFHTCCMLSGLSAIDTKMLFVYNIS